MADPQAVTGSFGLGRAPGWSNVAADGLLFSGVLVGAGQRWAGLGPARDNPVGDNEGHGLEKTFWASEADIPRGSVV